MPELKRKRSPAFPSSDDDSHNGSGESSAHDSESDEVDITASLAGKSKRQRTTEQDNDDIDDETYIRQSLAKQNMKQGMEMLKKVKGRTKLAKGEVGGGSFQSMGLNPALLRALTLRGYRVPTPIQRLAIPALLASPPQDLVGMARTGSGKTFAYMIPLLQHLGGRHSTTFGTRGLILVPSRELALQVLKAGKEIARGWQKNSSTHIGDGEPSDATNTESLRWGLIIGGESLDEQFEMISNNPDIIIATPGRLLHLAVEMNLDLKSVQYVVYDEADRLFEMGFETALQEIIHRLPATRQSSLFSATLPKTLVEFAKAGLQNPKLVRLDAESKISSDLQMAFFSVKEVEKDASLLILLRDVIGVPLGEAQVDPKSSKNKIESLPHQTLIFAATKHHVEYLYNLLMTVGYAVSHVYGALDQTARTEQMDRFRQGLTSILVVTDVAARGIDIPVLENVINYDFPHGARVFVHRVGRTARAGRKGWAWSFVSSSELPHLLDLQLFLGRPLVNTMAEGPQHYTENLAIGAFERDRLDDQLEGLRAYDEKNNALETLRAVMQKGHKLYERTQGKASQASHNRAKLMMKDVKWSLAGSGFDPIVHAVLRKPSGNNSSAEDDHARRALLQVVSSFSPSETVFEIGNRGKTANAGLMKDRRKALAKIRRTRPSAELIQQAVIDDTASDLEVLELGQGSVEVTSEPATYQDPEFYMSHYQKDAMTDKGYSLKDGATFAEQARGATFGLNGDEALTGRQRHGSQLTWDKKKKKFTQGAGEGADNVKMVKTESGARLPASYRSGRFDEWKSKLHVNLPRVGETELPGRRSQSQQHRNGRFNHTRTDAAKPLDKLSKDYERKQRTQQKRSQAAGIEAEPKNGKSKGRYGSKSMGRVKTELKSVEQIRKSRETKEKRRAKNARPSRHKGKR
ncbi:DEAD-domain-containing protein [Sistotremastrum niveocremeum HHB9708]|uniref:RNA helicase n=1 Tax=Sistotremastrum niveocremeum HHB9708 TaxID=1314777 RepID=A0A165A4C8_9AGAM|nr:DEAD-domain-containing protein [Sistotremastrum niveocremeum HHB9708]